MPAQIAQLVVPADAFSTPQAAIVDWPRDRVYLWRNTPGTIRRYSAACATQSPIVSASLDTWLFAVDADPISGAIIAQCNADLSNGAPVRKYDPTSFALLATFGASIAGAPSYPTGVWLGQSLACVECNGVGYALLKESALSGGVAVIRTDTMLPAGFYAPLVSGSTDNRGIMCRGASGSTGASVFLTWDGSFNGQSARIPLYTVTIAPGAETYDPATWPTANAHIASSTIGTIAAAAIDPAWTTLQANSIGYDATDGQVLLDVTGNAGAIRRYIAKVSATAAAVIWVVPLNAPGTALGGYNVTRSQAMFLPSGALDLLRTDTGGLGTTAMAGVASSGGPVMSDDVSGLIVLGGSYTSGVGAPVAVSGTPSSFTGWAILAPVVVVAPDYAITLDEDTSLSSAVVATGPDGLVYTILDAPAHGVLTLNADGSYTYDAARAWFGADGFTYRATDPVSGAFDDGTVTITVPQAFPLTGVVKVLLPPAELQFCDANGVPYAGGTLEFYEPGTSNPKDTWSSPTGDTDTLNTNPLVLDAAGRALIYGDGAYRTVLRDAAGNLVWDQPSFTYVSACMVPVVGAADLATARQAMGVTDAIEAEAEARAAADSAEATARAAADTALGARIDAETARAEAAEAALGTRIDGLPPPAAASNVQGGEARFGADGHARITFPTPFATACASIVAIHASVGLWPGSICANTPDRFGVDVWGTTFGSRTPAAGGSFFWLAVGD